jgi:hypothetical protein
MNIGLELQIFSLSDDNLDMPEDMSVPLNDCVLIPYTFYSIDFITRDRSNKKFTNIGSGGDIFTCNERYEVVKSKIEQISILRFN